MFAAMFSVPVPSGPAVTGFAAVPVNVTGVLLAPTAMPPKFRFTPPLKVLAPVSCSRPAPVLAIVTGVPLSGISEEMFSAGLIFV